MPKAVIQPTGLYAKRCAGATNSIQRNCRPYGIDNIFKVLRVDAIHQLTYRDNLTRTGIPITPFAIKLSGWLSL